MIVLLCGEFKDIKLFLFRKLQFRHYLMYILYFHCTLDLFLFTSEYKSGAFYDISINVAWFQKDIQLLMLHSHHFFLTNLLRNKDSITSATNELVYLPNFLVSLNWEKNGPCIADQIISIS